MNKRNSFNYFVSSFVLFRFAYFVLSAQRSLTLCNPALRLRFVIYLNQLVFSSPACYLS